jgi:hypothetical protein
VREREATGGAIVRVRIAGGGFDAFEVVALLDLSLRDFVRATDGRVLALTGSQIVLSASTAAGPYVETDIGFGTKEAVDSGDPERPFLVWGDAGGVALGDGLSFMQLGPVGHTGDLNGVARVDEGEPAFYAADSAGNVYRSTGGRWDLLELVLHPTVRACAGVDECGVPSVTRWQWLSAARSGGRTTVLAIPSMCDLVVSIDPETRIADALSGSETLMLETGLGLYGIDVAAGEAFLFGGEARLLRIDL